METDDAVGAATGNAMDAATGNDLGAVADTTTDNAMDLKLAMRQRHTVRKFTSEPLSAELISQLNDRVCTNNERFGLAISLKVGDESALPGALKLFFAKGVRNYFVLAGSDRPGLDEDLGYASADLMLFAQALGLNTWWIGGTFNRKNVEQAVPGKKVIGIVAVGFGVTPGVAHKSKTAAEVSSYEGPEPQWFADGVQAALLAPTALNKQCFRIAGAGNKVSITENGGAFSGADIGIVKYHFELGAGTAFEWA
ncbi:nitroreductase family protein [uncultured Senegalimassilia sp.]|uniref:nitroreductase family protein n=1 Tax=uncultured Senegalimassilia sp. TaxID=1714350 RepID=UPI0025CD04C7|nr:nitroreductase family protein [uncultured Senegalimassilia sp.]